MVFHDTLQKYDSLVTVVKKFRECLDIANQKGLITIGLNNFPKGACGDATILLGTFLLDREFGEFNYVCGERGKIFTENWTSHAWLQKRELIVDITVDQFDDIDDKVIVTDKSNWHRQFTIVEEYPACYRNYDEHARIQLEYAYKNIVKIYDTTQLSNYMG